MSHPRPPMPHAPGLWTLPLVSPIRPGTLPPGLAIKKATDMPDRFSKRPQLGALGDFFSDLGRLAQAVAAMGESLANRDPFFASCRAAVDASKVDLHIPPEYRRQRGPAYKSVRGACGTMQKVSQTRIYFSRG